MKISVCIISYNHSNFIRECLDNVLSQDIDSELEIVISDDHSTDSTAEVISEYVSKHPEKMKVFFQEFNLGAIKNFQFAINQCTGDYIALCEGDDYWTDPLKLQKQINFLEKNPDTSAVFHDSDILSKTGKSGKYAKYSDSQFVSDESVILIGGGLFPTASLVFRNFFRDNPLNGIEKYLSGDRALIYELLIKGKIYYMNEVMCVYRIHDQGIFSASLSDSKKSLAIHYSNVLLLQDYSKKFNQNHLKYFQKAISIQWKFILLKEKVSLPGLISKWPDLAIRDFFYLMYKSFRSYK